MVGDIESGKGCALGACALVNKSCVDNLLIAGVPSKKALAILIGLEVLDDQRKK